MTFISRPWESLTRSTQVRLYHQGDPRVPGDFTPAVRGPYDVSRPAVSVALDQLVNLDEKQLWEVLWSGWKVNGIDPTSVRFTFRDRIVGEMPPPPCPPDIDATVQRARTVSPKPTVTPKATQVQCEHCKKVLTEQGYHRFHGVKCWRAP
jgi:hypothetical protein